MYTGWFRRPRIFTNARAGKLIKICGERNGPGNQFPELTVLRTRIYRTTEHVLRFVGENFIYRLGRILSAIPTGIKSRAVQVGGYIAVDLRDYFFILRKNKINSTMHVQKKNFKKKNANASAFYTGTGSGCETG